MARILIYLNLLFFSLLSVNTAASDAEFLPVAQAFPYTVLYEQNTVSIHWNIADHYYLYHERISLKQNGQPLTLTFNKAPIQKHDEYFGQVKIYKGELMASAQVASNSPISLSFQGCAEAGLCYPPVRTTLDPPAGPVQTHPSASADNVKTSSATDTNSVSGISAILLDGNIFWQMLIFFALGIGLAFTPCVFPMIPILSSIIVGQGDSLTTRKAFAMSLTYVLAMAFTYALAGVVVGYFGAQANIQLYLQSPWVLGSFALVFVALSFSMFGFYELQLPRGIQDKLNQWNHNQKGGQLTSVAIMGSLSALVVSPCVSAPLAGTLVYISTTGDALLGGAALLALGLGMGLPLLIIGTGGSKFLPKAGTWMNGVKAVFGVSLLAVAIWLLERIIPASITMMLWAMLLIGSGSYLGAFEQNTKGWMRLFKAIGLVFSLYGALLIIGVAMGNHNPLKPLEGINQNANAPQIGVMQNGTLQTLNKTTIYNQAQLQSALAQAASENKLAVLDFYADWCIACKIMDEEIFNQADVQNAMNNVVFIQMDMTDNTKDQLVLLEQFGLFGPPAVLFFQNKAELKGLRIVGEVGKDIFMEHLKRAK